MLTVHLDPPRKKRAVASSAAALAAPAKKPTTTSWEESLKRWAAPLTASSAASATETKVRWLLSDKAESVKKSIEGAIDKRLAGWRPGKDCSCEREEKEYARGECPGCGDWDCCGECDFLQDGGGRETLAEMRERCLEDCDERNEWESEAREAVPERVSAWVKKVVRIVVSEANAKLGPTKKCMLLGARAAIANLADFDEFVGTAVQELADEELQELIAPEEEDTVCECCGEVACAEKDDLTECEYCGGAVHSDMILGDDGGFCERCDLVDNMRGCPCHRQCSYSRSQRLFECQAM